ncbi:MAG: hypothetical protein ACLFQ5_09160 [Oceanicaulis sp.]
MDDDRGGAEIARLAKAARDAGVELISNLYLEEPGGLRHDASPVVDTSSLFSPGVRS